MKLYMRAKNEKGKTVTIGSDSMIEITLTNGNKVKGMLAFEMWGEDTTEPFLACQWYPNGNINDGRALEMGSKKGEKQKGECMNKDSNGNACYDCESGQGMECGSTEEC
jgi:hypothetical protein